MINKINTNQLTSYNIDASRLSGIAKEVIFPETIEDIENAIKTAKIDIVPRGGGTNLVGGCVPNNSLIVDLSKMNKITNFEPKKGTVKVEAGTTIKELGEKLNALGFEFPIKIPNPSATIGGMIAVNAFGEYTLKYGGIKEWIQEIEFVNGRGELMKTSKADLSDVCGMEGITGIIARATLSIIPKTKNSISIFQSENLDEILAISRRLKLEKEVVMLQLLPPFLSKLLDFPEKYNLLIEFNSERGKIRGKEYDKLSKIKNKVYYKIFSEKYYNVESPKFFFDKIKEFISFLELNKIHYFAYLGSGIVHPFFKDDEKNKRKAVIDLMKKSTVKPSIFGIGLLKKDLVDSFEKKIIERIKRRHDPFGKLNKGKLIDLDFQEKRLEHIEETGKKELPEKFYSSSSKELKTVESDELIKSTENLGAIEDLFYTKSDKNLVVTQGAEPLAKIQELINEAKKIDEIEEQIKDKEAGEKEINDKEIDSFKKLANEQILSSESSENRKIIGEFTKNIGRTSSQQSDYKQTEDQKPSTPKVDYRNIQDIMTNKNKSVEQGKASMQDNLERESKIYQKPKTSKEEQDLIDSIMANKSPKNGEDKKDEHRDR